MFVLAFALGALGYRASFGTPAQTALRTMTVLVAIYVGSIGTPNSMTRRVPVVILGAVLVALLSFDVARLVLCGPC